MYAAEAPKGEVINSVGAGDSMVAGFLSGYMEKEDYAYAFGKYRFVVYFFMHILRNKEVMSFGVYNLII